MLSKTSKYQSLY